MGLDTYLRLLQTYFDAKRPRTDPFVCVNVLRLLYRYDRGNEIALQGTKSWVVEVLTQRTYLDGSRYYPSPDVFLFYLSQLLKENSASDLHELIGEHLSSRLKERIGVESDAISIAMRLSACKSLGIWNKHDRKRLLALQCEDGGWSAGCLCCTGKQGTRIGNRGLATALAVKALG